MAASGAAALGLVGHGRWGRNIFRDLNELGVVVHVADPSPEARATAMAAGAKSVCEAVGQLPDLDGYVVASLTTTHAEAVDVLARRGKPLFVEKPLSNDVAAARRMVSQGNDRLFVMDKWRYHPAITTLAQQVRAGVLGDVVAIRTVRVGWAEPHTDVDSVWILLPHDLSIVMELIGRLPKATAAFCGVPGRPGCDLVAILDDEDGGLRVTAEISISQPLTRRSVVVIGSRGAAQWQDGDTKLTIAPGQPGHRSGDVYSIDVGTSMPLREELRAFVSHVLGGPPPRATGMDGLIAVERVQQLRSLAGLS